MSITTAQQILKTVQQLPRHLPRRWPGLPLWNVRSILGIACTGHGASLAYLGADGVIRSSVLDRWTGVKNTLMFSADEDSSLRQPASDFDSALHGLLVEGYGKFPETRVFEQTLQPWLEWFLHDQRVTADDIDLVVTSDSHFATNWTRIGLQLNDWFPYARIVRNIEHHAIHQRQAFWQSGFEEAAVLTLDTCGEALERLGERKLSGTIALMNDRGGYKVLKEFFFPEASAGLMYETVNLHIGFSQGEEGKTMGLAPYGEPELFEQLRGRLRLQEDGSFTFIPHQEFKAILADYVPARRSAEITQRHMNVAYAGQAILEAIVTNAFQAALRHTQARDLAYAGGVALNSVANSIAARAAQPRRLYIATNPGDTGHALGCALYGAYEVAHWTPPRQEVQEYLGPSYTLAELETAVRGIGFPVERPNPQLADIVAQCIANGYILARFDGGAEFGPRALGNRSILCDPRRGDMKDYLNVRVKHREAFRPFAPTVLEDQAAAWFEMEGRSAYMLHVVPVRREVRDAIPAIVHVDGTARVQTLARHENPGYWDVIAAFHRLTGVPLVLNTSFNLAGKPIVETPADAVSCFAATQIDILALGPYIMSKYALSTYLSQARP